MIDQELLTLLLNSLIPVIGGALLYMFKQFLASRDVELTEQGEEVARQKILAAIERVAGALRTGEYLTFEEAVEYVEDRMKESLEVVGMSTQALSETLTIEVQRQGAPVKME